MITLTQKQVDKFWSNVDRRGEDECWTWLAYKQGSGHGQLTFGQKRYYAHRIAYYLSNADYNEFLCVIHKCDNPPCCNPKHLIQGTQSENMRDMVNKGRNTKGTEVSGVLSEEQVLEIIRLNEEGYISQKGLARKFGVSYSQINRIVNGRRWRHLGAVTGTEIAVS